ncbi:MAG: hypothetical protein V7664_00905 [Qipengyuania sp.]|uniref:hypothetical protein n=1 Tax=Qipengyuania sp. TaxID=2004515 RepID=UPI0030036CFE
MRNDLVIFEFENSDGREVLLNPNVIGTLGNSLADIFKAALIAFRDEQGAELPARMRNVDIRLAAVEPGSIRAGFRVFFGNLTTEDRENIEFASAAVTLIDTVIGWIFSVGIAAAVFHQSCHRKMKERRS